MDRSFHFLKLVIYKGTSINLISNDRVSDSKSMLKNQLIEVPIA